MVRCHSDAPYRFPCDYRGLYSQPIAKHIKAIKVPFKTPSSNATFDYH